jgi:hypothetical protein
VAKSFQLVIDCADPDRLAHFWIDALGYVEEPPPPGYADWDAYYREVGVSDEDLGIGVDRIVDPDGTSPRIWFQKVPEAKTVKNRVHVDIRVSGGRGEPIELRRERIDAEAQRLIAAGASQLRVLDEEGLDHYGIVLRDPEGNEFCLH